MGPLSATAAAGLPAVVSDGASVTDTATSGMERPGESAFAQLLAALGNDAIADAVSAIDTGGVSGETTGADSGTGTPSQTLESSTEAALAAIAAQLTAVAGRVEQALDSAGAGSAAESFVGVDATTLAGSTASTAIDSGHPATPAAGTTGAASSGATGSLDELLVTLAQASETAKPDVLTGAEPGETQDSLTALAETAVGDRATETAAPGAAHDENLATADAALPTAGATAGQDTPAATGPIGGDNAANTPAGETSRSIHRQPRDAAGADNAAATSMDAARSVWGKVDLARAARSVEASVEVGEHNISVTARQMRGGIDIAIDAPAALGAALGGFEREQLKRELSDAGVNVRDVHVEEREEAPRRQRQQDENSQGDTDA